MHKTEKVGQEMTIDEIIERLQKCAVGNCEGCPNRYVDNRDVPTDMLITTQKDVKLLLVAAMLLTVAYIPEGKIVAVGKDDR